MKLGLPLGLLALLFILGLILIYILKPKYQDKKVASTYVWKLSLKYAKRKVPLQWLRSSLLLIIQILIFAVLAFMLARPYIVTSSTRSEKIVILDGSASMMAQKNDISLFDRAIKEIQLLSDSTTEHDPVTVILASDEASYVVRRTDSDGYVRQKLTETECTLAEPDFSKAMELAEAVLAENPYAEVHLYTDTDYEDSGKVIVHNMASEEWNVAVLSFTANRLNGKYVFSAEIASYGQEAEFSVGLNVDGKSQVPKLAACEANGTVNVVWETNSDTYKSAEVRLQGVDDTFSYDNEYCLFNSNAERFKVQLESVDPDFLHRALSVVNTCDIVVTDEYTPAQTVGFDLYIYDGVLPEEKPTDGAVWLIAPPFDDSESAATLYDEWGISFSKKIKGEFALSSAGGTSAVYNTIMRNVSPSTILVTEYSQPEYFENYESLMMSGEDPVLLAKEEDGLKTIVLAFDIHMSDMPIRYSFPMLVRNICSYTLAHMVEDTIFTVGDTVRLTAKPDAKTMTVNAVYSDGTEEISTYTDFPVDFKAVAPGSYTVTQVFSGGRTVTDSFYVHVSENESVFGKTEGTLINPVVFAGDREESVSAGENKEIFIYLAAAMLVLMCIEWGLQYREQF